MNLCTICGEMYTCKCDKCGKLILEDRNAASIYDTFEIKIRVAASEKKVLFHGDKIEGYMDKKSIKKGKIKGLLAACLAYICAPFAGFLMLASKDNEGIDVTTVMSEVKNMTVEGTKCCFELKKKKYVVKLSTDENAMLLYETWKKNVIPEEF